MPRTWLPDMEPEASTTIMASHCRAKAFFPSAGVETLPTTKPARPWRRVETSNGGKPNAEKLPNHCPKSPDGFAT